MPRSHANPDEIRYAVALTSLPSVAGILSPSLPLRNQVVGPAGEGCEAGREATWLGLGPGCRALPQTALPLGPEPAVSDTNSHLGARLFASLVP